MVVGFALCFAISQQLAGLGTWILASVAQGTTLELLLSVFLCPLSSVVFALLVLRHQPPWPRKMRAGALLICVLSICWWWNDEASLVQFVYAAGELLVVIFGYLLQEAHWCIFHMAPAHEPLRRTSDFRCSGGWGAGGQLVIRKMRGCSTRAEGEASAYTRTTTSTIFKSGKTCRGDGPPQKTATVEQSRPPRAAGGLKVQFVTSSEPQRISLKTISSSWRGNEICTLPPPPPRPHINPPFREPRSDPSESGSRTRELEELIEHSNE